MALTFKYAISIVLLLLCNFLVAQKGIIDISTEKSVSASNGQLVSLIVKLENKSDLEGNFRLVAKSGPNIRLLKPSSAINIGAKESIYLSFKFLVTKNQPAGQSPLVFTLEDADGNKVANSTTLIEVASKRLLRISTTHPQEIIYQVGDSLKIQTEVYNGGNSSEKIKVIATFPSLSGNVITEEKSLTVKAFSRVPIVFSKIIDRDLLRLELFNVSIALLNNDNEFLGNAMVLVQNALGNRRYIDPEQNRLLNLAGRGNQISWSIRNPFRKKEAAQNLNLNAVVNTGNLRTELIVNGTYHHDPSLPTLFQNTSIRLERQGLGLKLGNLANSDLDISLTGRGAEFYLLPWENRKTTFRIGAVEKSYNLFDPLDLKNSTRGYSAFATINNALSSKTQLATSLIYDQDLFSNNVLLTTRYQYRAEKTQYQISLGYGNSQTRDDSNLTQDSFSAGLNYSTQWKDYTFNSEDYYSTGYYPGIRKGSTVLNQRLNRRLGNANLWANYSFSLSQPQNLNPLYWYAYSNERHRAELGAQFPVTKKITLSLSPQFHLEKSNLYRGDFENTEPIEFRSYSINQNVTLYTADDLHRFNLSVQEGASQYIGKTKPSFILKSQFNYYFKNLGISLSAQKGNFLLYEGSSPQGLNTDTKKYSGLVSYKLDLFERKLNLNFSGMGSKETYLGTSISLNTNAELSLGPNTKFFAYYSYIKYLESIYDFSRSYFQFGITQMLPQLGDPVANYKNGAIEVFVYHDTNNNRVYEAELDFPAVGKKVSINKTVFITEKDGTIKYRKVPYGDYSVKSLESDWYAETQKTHLNSKVVSLQIPLEKTGRVIGYLTYDTYNKSQFEVSANLTGIEVVFRDDLGHEFKFYTNDRGRYDAFLPLGTYSMSVNPESLQQKVYVDVAPLKFTAKELEATELPTITLKIRERQVEITRFGE